MAVVINGNGTVTGISVGGLPDGIVDSGTLATNSVDSAELIDGSIDTAHIAADQITGAILPAGSVLQVVSSNVQSTTYSTNTDTWIDSGLSVSITPSSTSSKILVLAAPALSTTIITGSGTFGGVRVLRDSTSITNNERFDLYTLYNHQIWVMNLLDSPNTTSSVTYKVQMKAHSDGNATIESAHHNNENTITVLEIGA